MIHDGIDFEYNVFFRITNEEAHNLLYAINNQCEPPSLCDGFFINLKSDFNVAIMEDAYWWEDMVDMTAYFTNKEDALLFKLTYGGV